MKLGFLRVNTMSALTAITAFFLVLAWNGIFAPLRAHRSAASVLSIIGIMASQVVSA